MNERMTTAEEGFSTAEGKLQTFNAESQCIAEITKCLENMQMMLRAYPGATTSGRLEYQKALSGNTLNGS